jgi:hypothetical protein
MNPQAGKHDEQSLLLSEIVANTVICMRDGYGTAFVGLELDDTIQIHEASVAVIRGFLAERYYMAYADYPAKRLLDGTAESIMSKCLVAPVEELGYRVRRTPDGIYYDLGRPDWGSFHLSRRGTMSYNSPSPVYFRRTSGMDALPEPAPFPLDQLLPTLQALAPLHNEDQELLRLGFLLASLWPEGPYPILNLYGPPESGKGYHSRFIRMLVDPVKAPLQGIPHHEQELLLEASRERLLVLDNVSKLPAWGSNTLCRISTGTAYRKKKLYTDVQVLTLNVCNPILVNSVDQVLTAPDLVSRSMFIDLPPMPDVGRRDENEMLLEVAKAAPGILWALFKIVCESEHRPPVVKSQSRITPTFRLMTTAERLLGLDGGTFERAYNRNRSIGHDIVLSEYAYLSALRDMVNEGEGVWVGSAKDLMGRITTKVKASLRGDNWPTSATELTKQLRGMAPSLTDIGLTVSFNSANMRLGGDIKLKRGR